MFRSHDQRLNTGILFMRIGFAASLFLHALPRLFGSASYWEATGKTMSFIKLDFPVKWMGFSILLLEIIVGFGLVSGYFFRTLCLLASLVYGLNLFHYYQAGYTVLPMYALAILIACIGLCLTGPGSYIIAFTQKGK